jgi:putative membrane protein
MVKSLLSESDAREVEAAVARVEGQSAAELVIAVVPRSADYWQARVALAVAWALAAGFAFLHFAPWHEPALALALEVVVGLLAFGVSSATSLRRVLVPPRAAEQAVQARAFQLFSERGLHATRSRTALLIFVSELEHRVVLLGDHSIDERLGQAGWDEYVKLLITYIRRNECKAGLLEVIARLEPQLAAVAPREHDDVNELPDAVLRS